MSRSYRPEHTENRIKVIVNPKSNVRTSHTQIEDEDGMVCPNCKKFCTFTYLARHSYCYSCKHEIPIEE